MAIEESHFEVPEEVYETFKAAAEVQRCTSRGSLE